MTRFKYVVCLWGINERHIFMIFIYLVQCVASFRKVSLSAAISANVCKSVARGELKKKWKSAELPTWQIWSFYNLQHDGNKTCRVIYNQVIHYCGRLWLRRQSGLSNKGWRFKTGSLLGQRCVLVQDTLGYRKGANKAACKCSIKWQFNYIF